MNSKRTHLSLEIKHFIVLEKKRRPKISQTELVWEVNRKFGVSTSRRAIRTALNSKNIIEAAMVNATKAGKKRTRVVSEKRSDFESLLDSTLKKFLKRNLNADVARIAAENLLKDHPRVGKNKFDRRIQFGRATDGQGRRGRIFAASCIKRT